MTPKLVGSRYTGHGDDVHSKCVDDDSCASEHGDEHAHAHAHEHAHAHAHEHAHAHAHEHEHEHAHAHEHGHAREHAHEHGHGQKHVGQHSHGATEAANHHMTFETWRNGIMATALISSASLVTMPFLGFLSRPAVLKMGMAFAVGGLLGDVFLHIIPHEMGGHDHGSHVHDHGHGHDRDHDHDHDHDHGHGAFPPPTPAPPHPIHPLTRRCRRNCTMLVTFMAGHADTHSHSLEDLRPGLFIITGIVVFLVIDKAMRAAMGGSGTISHSHGHGDGSGHSDSSVNEQKVTTDSKHSRGDKHERRSRSPSVSTVPDSHGVVPAKPVAKSCAQPWATHCYGSRAGISSVTDGCRRLRALCWRGLSQNCFSKSRGRCNSQFYGWTGNRCSIWPWRA